MSTSLASPFPRQVLLEEESIVELTNLGKEDLGVAIEGTIKREAPHA